jgi:replicative DNA helicase
MNDDLDPDVAVLYAMIHANPVDRTPLGMALNGHEFPQAQHEELWHIMLDLEATQPGWDAFAVLAEVRRRNQTERLHKLLLDAVSYPGVIPMQGLFYAGLVREAWQSRNLADHARSIAERADRGVLEPAEALEYLRQSTLSVQPAQVTDLMDLDQFADLALPDEEWIIPGILARGDRLILTGAEGLGKSMLTRQLAVCAGVGLHPFGGGYFTPRKVLVVDVENPTRIMRDRFYDIRAAVRALGITYDRRNIQIVRRPEGMDLAQKDDRDWLADRMHAHRPDLLVIGPAYKLYNGGGFAREEDLARSVTAALDALRERYHCSLILEAHSPLPPSGAHVRDLRPFGSSLWMRWPEFGYGIRATIDSGGSLVPEIVTVHPWRGPRDERRWPLHLKRGEVRLELPWNEYVPPKEQK